MTKIVKKSKNKNGREIEQKKTFNKDRNVKNMSHIMISKKKNGRVLSLPLFITRYYF